MILLLGGTSETRPIALALAESGQSVLVSMATDEPLDVGNHPHIRRRSGRLDDTALETLIRQENITCVVDATHPYAAGIRATASGVAARMGLPYFSYVRESFLPAADRRIHIVGDHARAAEVAFSFGRPVLLTTGSRNLTPYVRQSRQTAIRLVARVLHSESSMRACLDAGIPAEHIIAAKGPFSVEQNQNHIQRYGIGVLVTKDSGEAGGLPAKLEAAEREACQVVLISRPVLPRGGLSNVQEFVKRVLASLGAGDMKP